MSWKNQILQNISISTAQGKKALQAQNNIPAIKKPNWNHHTPTIKSRILPRKHLPPTIKHGLHRVLNHSGPQFLLDPKSSNYNFPEYLSQIPDLDTFDFSKISEFKLPYEDQTLTQVALDNSAKFYSSTSSLSESLLHIIQMISPRKAMQKQSVSFMDKVGRFSEFLFCGTEFKLVSNNGAISINKHEVKKYHNVLASMGHLLEAFLTEEPSNFKSYLIGSPDYPKTQSVFNYNIINDKLLVRSQLDAIEGNKIFDLKSRAVYGIRNNIENYQDFTKSRIESMTGVMDSFEKEYRDMFFNAFMKYNLQGRMGNMDGYFITYHNTKEIFGFEYISQRKMDNELYHSQEKAENTFNLSVKIFTEILDTIIVQSENAHVFFAKPQENSMNVYVYIENEILQYTVSVQSFVNGRFEKRPLKANGDWKLYYNIEKVPLDTQVYNRQRDLHDWLREGGWKKQKNKNV